MLFENAMNDKRLIEFMKRLVINVGCKVILIFDNLKVYHRKPQAVHGTNDGVARTK